MALEKRPQTILAGSKMELKMSAGVILDAKPQRLYFQGVSDDIDD